MGLWLAPHNRLGQPHCWVVRHAVAPPCPLFPAAHTVCEACSGTPPLPPLSCPTYLLGTLLSGRQGAHQTGGLVAERRTHTHAHTGDGTGCVRSESAGGCGQAESRQGRTKQATCLHVCACVCCPCRLLLRLFCTPFITQPTHPLTHPGTVIQRCGWVGGEAGEHSTHRQSRSMSGHMQGHVNAHTV